MSSSGGTQSMAGPIFQTMFSRLVLLAPAFIVFIVVLVFGLAAWAVARNPTAVWGISIGSTLLAGILTSILAIGITCFMVVDLFDNKPLSMGSSWGRVRPLLGPLLFVGIILFVTGLTVLIPVPVVGSIIQGVLWTFITPAAVLICLRGEPPAQALVNGFNLMISMLNKDALTFVLILVFFMFAWISFGALYILAIPLVTLAIAYMLSEGGVEATAQPAEQA